MSDAPDAASEVAAPRVVIDTNVWVSAFINPRGAPAQLRFAWYSNQFLVVISPPMVEELAEVLSRPRLVHRFGIRPDEVEPFLRLLLERATVLELTGTLHECRDPDDDTVLETAVLGKAQYLVSRDDDIKADTDLIEKMSAYGIEVTTVRQFLQMLARSN